ncbi:Rsm22-domain-containing protein [Wolfiporia cocos MD-104 SS10]|uniref:Rsm22-domain-containing protein n=1 Tax=Wolfiporia cocos (strain MD-104) TaxID=742152 RepID=A0A2H3IVV3_WOLCO|nr:Rsm22-domain-containing protein [Wolfiporia cocos MD-104 SS10]
MLQSRCYRTALVLCRRLEAAHFSSTASSSSHQPNAPLDLDPSFQALLRDADISLLRQKSRHAHAINPHARVHRELEIFENDPLSFDDHSGPVNEDYLGEELDAKEGRKSPAALFGSQQIGHVVLPLELRQTIDRLIAGSDKHALHATATRLFSHDAEEGKEEWDTSYSVHYRSRKKATRHAEGDATAFASIALPSHYAAIYAVLDHLKRRLDPEWTVERVIDWGSGTGSGLWASSHSFQIRDGSHVKNEDPLLSRSALRSYTAIDKREGLVSIGKRLVQDIHSGDLKIVWQKAFHEDDKINLANSEGSLALSAFMLSTLPTPVARKTLVKEMWESGAGVIVLIDHNTTAGFECIAEAREYLLRLGKKEKEDPSAEHLDVRGSHVVAPCPHDGACPLYHPGASKLVCSFSQRLQRPDFVRKTKHSGRGYEDTGYSYVVIRRGSRPAPPGTKVGRVGNVGERELNKIASRLEPMQELVVEDSIGSTTAEANPSDSPDLTGATELIGSNEPQERERLDAALRLEAYSWPRLVFPPLKRSGHVIIDGCTAEGKIMRMTIPKSQGKQPYYDARKSGWGDIFPHESKNRVVERYQPPGNRPVQNGDIGKRKKTHAQAASYSELADGIKEQKQKRKKHRPRRVRADTQREEEDFLL